MSRDIDDIAVRLCAYWDSLVVQEASVAVTSERQRGSRVDGSEKRPSEETKSQGRLSDLARVHRRLSDERAGMKDAACARTVENARVRFGRYARRRAPSRASRHEMVRGEEARSLFSPTCRIKEVLFFDKISRGISFTEAKGCKKSTESCHSERNRP